MSYDIAFRAARRFGMTFESAQAYALLRSYNAPAVYAANSRPVTGRPWH